MSESFTLDTSCEPRPILVTGSGRVSYAPAPPATAADPEPETPEVPAPEPATPQTQAPAATAPQPPAETPAATAPRAKVLTAPSQQRSRTGAKPTTKSK